MAEYTGSVAADGENSPSQAKSLQDLVKSAPSSRSNMRKTQPPIANNKSMAKRIGSETLGDDFSDCAKTLQFNLKKLYRATAAAATASRDSADHGALVVLLHLA